MPGERLMPGEPESGGIPGSETEGTSLTPEQQKAVDIAVQKNLERILGRLGEGADEDAVKRPKMDEKAILAERYGIELKPGEHIEMIHTEIGEKPVAWPNTPEAAEKHIKDILGRIEIAKSSITKEMLLDVENAKAVLERMEVRYDKNLRKDENEKVQAWAKKMRLEIRVRIDLHQACFAYENKGSVKDVCEAVSSIPSAWMDVIFGLQEKITNTNESFNPFVEAMQYYEDHGHEFARNNVATKREAFGKIVQKYLVNYADKRNLGITKEVIINGAKYIVPKNDEELTAEDWDKYYKNTSYKLQKHLGLDPDKEGGLTSEEQKAYQIKIENKKEQIRKEKGKNVSDEESIRELYLERNKDYAWAQNMAERVFRLTGRAIMYDYLVINKGKFNERQVGIYYDGPETVEWAGGRDGCDYPMSKILRFRENLATSSEGKLMRPHLHLLDNVDIYSGDFWSKVLRENNIKMPEGAKTFKTIRITKEDLDKKIAQEITRLVEKEHKTREIAEIEANKIRDKYFVVTEPDLTKIEGEGEEKVQAGARLRGIYGADSYSDRETADNVGEMVEYIDFRQMERRRDKDGKLISGVDFEETMGDSPWGIWTVRRLTGPEEAKGSLSGNPEAFLLNPNFESLAKMLNAFDYSKANAWDVKRELLRNFIKFVQSERIEGTGKLKYTEDEILAGVNKLTGLIDQNGAQFVQLPERASILKEFFNIEVSLKDLNWIKEKAEKEARRKHGVGVTQEQIDYEANKEINKKLNSVIQKKLDIRFGRSWLIAFLLGLVKGIVKEVTGPLGGK